MWPIRCAKGIQLTWNSLRDAVLASLLLVLLVALGNSRTGLGSALWRSRLP